MKKYLLQIRHDDAGSDEPFIMLATAQQIIDAYGFDDCSGDRHAVFDAGTFGRVEPLTHVPATTAPFNYHIRDRLRSKLMRAVLSFKV